MHRTSLWFRDKKVLDCQKMSSTDAIYPGSGLKVQSVQTAYPKQFPKGEKPNVILTTVRIPDDHIWANGLFQNIYFIYKMLEVAGFTPHLMVNDNKHNTDAKIHKDFRLLDFGEFVQNPFKAVGYIEMGMSCDPGIRRYFRSTGCKVAKLYLGNILNIDIETITFLPSINFSHHVAGEIDEIWVSPHYDIHADYASSINGMPTNKTAIAPYVWDPMFIEELIDHYDDSALTRSSARNFVIMEPNISFQKNALIPILALEHYYRKYPELVDQVIVINGNKFKENPYFTSSIAPSLSILKNGKLQLLPRANTINVARVFKNAIVLQHQVNNSYNYSLFEWMNMGFPLIHNVKEFEKYGYYYDTDDFVTASAQIENIVNNHAKNAEAYKAHTKQLTWNFSIYNPVNAEAWKRLIIMK